MSEGREHCRCGAQIEVAGPDVWTAHRLQEFREAHAVCRKQHSPPRWAEVDCGELLELEQPR